MATESRASDRDVPEVVGDLDPDREIIRLGTGRAPAVHLADRAEDCIVLPSDRGQHRRAKQEFADREICRYCARGERES
jgi:hypothetical protein